MHPNDSLDEQIERDELLTAEQSREDIASRKSEARLIHAIGECKDSCPQEITAHIMRAADEFAAGAEQHDDMTLVVLRVGSR